MTRTIAVVTGTRAEYGLLRWVLTEILDRPAQLAEPAWQVAQVAHAEGGERAVERRVAIRQVVPVSGVRVDRGARPQLAAPGPQHLSREVNGRHRSRHPGSACPERNRRVRCWPASGL